MNLSQLGTAADALKVNVLPQILGISDPRLSERILAEPSFHPETFSVVDRMQGADFLFGTDADFDQWLWNSLAHDTLDFCRELDLTPRQSEEVLRHCLRETREFLQSPHQDGCIGATILNPESPDVLRRLLAFLLTGNSMHTFSSCLDFNNAVAPIVAQAIERQHAEGSELETLLRLSLMSGLIGLDLKGPSLVQSDSVVRGITIADLLHLPPQLAGQELHEQLMRSIVSLHFGREESRFFDHLLSRRVRLLWSFDDFIESHWDLLLLQSMMIANPELEVTVLPKAGNFGNDLSYTDTLQLLQQPPFGYLASTADNRFQVCDAGPCMGALHPIKINETTVECMEWADVIFIKGCRSHELTQGGLAKDSYVGYVVARDYSESESGLSSDTTPPVLFHLAPGEYAYWGFPERASRRMVAGNSDRTLAVASSTLCEHLSRRDCTDEVTLTTALAALRDLGKSRSCRPLNQELAWIEAKLSMLT